MSKRRVVAGVLAAVVLMVGTGTAGSVAGESGKRAAVERVSVDAFNEGFDEALCRPIRGNDRTDGGGWIVDGAGNVCGEYEPK
ncbi:hypothetical protein [Streptomyces sp. UNOB3_S3]|uniref:hypothetical protein n=1 Tax=Streptomyces sp. UNOB3_S3 TaxID=2871682 RepID=UPI001E55877E|nr:hypothetical protein [Streptomyces sp. UNOB3_S3]MCC3773657.1 hypothetical protein [Streptomyces sp. UNOB3_S3]